MQKPIEVPRLKSLGQAFYVSSYHPKDPEPVTAKSKHNKEEPVRTIKRVSQCIRWSYEPWS